MPINPAIQDYVADARSWRRELHKTPELLFDLPNTARFVADRLREFGCDEVGTSIGRTGVVGVIRGRLGSGNRAIGLRADMDALPIHEVGERPYRSRVPGKMHACGHDGHTAMLLGAARYLAQTRNFSGAAVLIFQPAEEGGGGAKLMLEDGLMDRFPVDEVYGMHNMPHLPVGAFALRKGALMASADKFTITVEGRGGHAAMPHQCVDPLLATAHIVTALQSVAARNVNPLDSCVVTVTQFHAGSAFNIIPNTAELMGTVRALNSATRDLAEKRIAEIATAVSAAMGAKATYTYERNYPVTINHPEQTDFAAEVARTVSAAGDVDTAVAPVMGSEDFSFMLEARPGAFIFIGNGESAALHHPAYDFNDDALPYGMSYWVELIETALAA